MPTTAPDACTHHTNLTYSQWVIIFDFIKANPKVKQYQVVDHFTAKGWQLTQGNLLRLLKQQDWVCEQLSKTIHIVNAKQPRVVVCPTVECGLIIWFQAWKACGKAVTGPMLLVK